MADQNPNTPAPTVPASTSDNGTGTPVAPVPVPPAAPVATPNQYQVLQYHGLPPSPPVLGVDFDSCNVRAWEVAIKRYARTRGIMPAITGNSQSIDPGLYENMCLEADSVIQPSITEKAFTPDSMRTYLSYLRTLLSPQSKPFAPRRSPQVSKRPYDKKQMTFVSREMKRSMTTYSATRSTGVG